MRPAEEHAWSIHEADFVSDGPAPPVPPRLLGPGFRQVSYEKVGRLYVRRYAMPGPDLAPLRLRLIRRAGLGFAATAFSWTESARNDHSMVWSYPHSGTWTSSSEETA